VKAELPSRPTKTKSLLLPKVRNKKKGGGVHGFLPSPVGGKGMNRMGKKVEAFTVQGDLKRRGQKKESGHPKQTQGTGKKQEKGGRSRARLSNPGKKKCFGPKITCGGRTRKRGGSRVLRFRHRGEKEKRREKKKKTKGRMRKRENWKKRPRTLRQLNPAGQKKRHKRQDSRPKKGGERGERGKGASARPEKGHLSGGL